MEELFRKFQESSSNPNKPLYHCSREAEQAEIHNKTGDFMNNRRKIQFRKRLVSFAKYMPNFVTFTVQTRGVSRRIKLFTE